MKIGIHRASTFFFFLFLCLFIFPQNSFAFTISNVPVNGQNDFILEPGKAEFYLDPGESATKDIFITNRTSHSVTFKVQIEDFIGSDNPTSPVVLLEGDESPYSFKQNLKPEVGEFTLKSGQKISLPVKIEVPTNQPPGGYYSSVLISNEPTVDANLSANDTAGKTKTVSRLGTLFFIRVNGLADESGKVDDFRIKGPQKLFYQKGPFTFEILFNNTGSVHLIPHGTIEIKNMLGKVVKTLPVDAYFSLPHSTRYREVTWDPSFLLGRYSVHLSLDRGYDRLTDEKTIAIWVVPWKYIGILAGIIFFLFTIIYYIKSNFEFKRKE